MSITTFRLTVDLLRPNGTAIANAPVTAVLTKADVSLTEGQIGKVMLETTSNTQGSAVLQLWPNTKGMHGSQYRIKALDPETGVKLLDATVTMPANDCHLRDILQSPPPATKCGEGVAVEAIQQTRIEVGNLKAAAEQAASNAANAEQAAKAQATQSAEHAAAAATTRAATEQLKDTVTAAAVQVTTHKTAVEADRLAVDRAKAQVLAAQTTTAQNAETASAVRTFVEAAKNETRAAKTEAVTAHIAAQDAQTAAERSQNEARHAAQTATARATAAELSADTAGQIKQDVVNERGVVTRLKDDCVQHETRAGEHNTAAQGAANSASASATTASQKALDAKASETSAAQFKSDAEAAKVASEAAADRHATLFAQFATDITKLETLILQQHG